MRLKSTCVSLLLLLTAICTYGQDQPVSPRVTGQEGAAGAQVLINEVMTFVNGSWRYDDHELSLVKAFFLRASTVAN